MSNCLEQQRVSAAHVMVVGCGALGNEVLKNLVLLGVEHLVVVDFDVVEVGNLSFGALLESRCRSASVKGRGGCRASEGYESCR